MRNFIHLVFIIYTLLSVIAFHLWILHILEISMPEPQILKWWDYKQFLILFP